MIFSVNYNKTYSANLFYYNITQKISDSKIWPKTGGCPFPIFHLIFEKIVRDACDDRKMEISNEQVIFVCADDIMMMGKTKEEVINATLKLINVSKGIGVYVNEGKTKYIVVSRKLPNISFIVVGNYKFEKVQNFKYLGVNINSKNDMYIKIEE